MATNEYPKMLFKYPSETVDNIECVDGRFDIIAVDSKEEEVAAIKEGWFFTPPEAKQAVAPKKPEKVKSAARVELEQKADELKIVFDSKVTDKELSKLIENKLAWT